MATGPDFKDVRNASPVSYEITNAATELQNAQNNMAATLKNYELSQTIYHNQEAQFRLGSFEYDKLLDTDKAIGNAETSYIRATCDYLAGKAPLSESRWWVVNFAPAAITDEQASVFG